MVADAVEIALKCAGSAPCPDSAERDLLTTAGGATLGQRMAEISIEDSLTRAGLDAGISAPAADRVTLSLTPHSQRSPNGTMRFDAYHDGALVCTSHQPLLDGARALLDLGYPPETLLTTRHVGNSYDNVIPAPIGKLAGLTTEESSGTEARLRKYRPHPGGREGHSMRKSPSEVSGHPSEEIALYGEPAP
jgi:hypothetical protein